MQMMVEVMMDVMMQVHRGRRLLLNSDSRARLLTTCERSVLRIRKRVEKGPFACHLLWVHWGDRWALLVVKTLPEAGGVLLAEIEISIVLLSEGLIDELLKMEEVLRLLAPHQQHQVGG